MSLFVIPVGFNGECCDCDRAIDACTCCPILIGTDQYEEYISIGCSGIGPPCGEDEDTADCANATIGPVKLSSPPFKTKCLDSFVPRAMFSIYADNYGSVIGKTTINYNNGPCETVSVGGSIAPLIERVNATESRAFIRASAQNSVAGGPYGLGVYVEFFLDNNDE